jgi:hypothetical protein
MWSVTAAVLAQIVSSKETGSSPPTHALPHARTHPARTHSLTLPPAVQKKITGPIPHHIALSTTNSHLALHPILHLLLTFRPQIISWPHITILPLPQSIIPLNYNENLSKRTKKKALGLATGSNNHSAVDKQRTRCSPR